MVNTFEYKGHKLVEEKEYEDDNIKIFHMVILPDETVTHMPHSPYENVTEESFRRWVDMGMPKAQKGNLLNSEISKMWEEFNKGK